MTREEFRAKAEAAVDRHDADAVDELLEQSKGNAAFKKVGRKTLSGVLGHPLREAASSSSSSSSSSSLMMMMMMMIMDK